MQTADPISVGCDSFVCQVIAFKKMKIKRALTSLALVLASQVLARSPGREIPALSSLVNPGALQGMDPMRKPGEGGGLLLSY